MTGVRPVRLLDLLPETGDSIICCELKQDNLSSDSLEPYYAVSYTWGVPEPLCKIKVNGKELSIRKNLFDMLLAMRQRNPEGQPRLWIDAICINQEDVAEKNQQVQQMKHIYSEAETVYSWLGLSDKNSDIVIDEFYARTKGLEQLDK